MFPLMKLFYDVRGQKDEILIDTITRVHWTTSILRYVE